MSKDKQYEVLGVNTKEQLQNLEKLFNNNQNNLTMKIYPFTKWNIFIFIIKFPIIFIKIINPIYIFF